jgi:hypothetical protein
MLRQMEILLWSVLPRWGPIFICGYGLSAGGTALTATLGYGTAATGAAFTSITQAYVMSPTQLPLVFDNSTAFRGLYVPPGNNVLLNESTTGTIGYTIYYLQQNTR